MSHQDREQVRAALWKQATPLLSPSARPPAAYVGKDGRAGSQPYDYCLPAATAEQNLLPEVRTEALALFAALGIPWHAGVGSGPSNNLLSSQVQCANALVPMVGDPERLRRAFHGVVEVGEVLEVEPGRYLTFEYIGPVDFFGESPGRDRVRGAHCTSVDAAFLHRRPDGLRELVLVEWKYTETYRRRQPEPGKDAVRLQRYGAALLDPSGPVHGDRLPLEAWLQEPLYQLVRQQLLAHALERHGLADRVVVVHVSPPANDDYRHALSYPPYEDLGDTVAAVWSRLLRDPTRFRAMSSDVFLDPLVTSPAYCDRYGSWPRPALRPDATAADPHCARCGARLVPVVHGYPGPDLVQAAQRGEVLLGGCTFDPPLHAVGCPQCGLPF